MLSRAFAFQRLQARPLLSIRYGSFQNSSFPKPARHGGLHLGMPWGPEAKLRPAGSVRHIEELRSPYVLDTLSM